MPIKDISKEEQAHLFLTGGVKREHMQLTESDRGDTNILIICLSFSPLNNCSQLSFKVAFKILQQLG